MAESSIPQNAKKAQIWLTLWVWLDVEKTSRKKSVVNYLCIVAKLITEKCLRSRQESSLTCGLRSWATFLSSVVEDLLIYFTFRRLQGVWLVRW